MIIVNDKDGNYIGTYTTLTKAMKGLSGMNINSYFYLSTKIRQAGFDKAVTYKGYQVIRTEPNSRNMTKDINHVYSESVSFDDIEI